jgi:hypothetical protein
MNRCPFYLLFVVGVSRIIFFCIRVQVTQTEHLKKECSHNFFIKLTFAWFKPLFAQYMKAHTHPLYGSQAETPSFHWPKNGIFRQKLKYGFTEKGRKVSEKCEIKPCDETNIDLFSDK